MQKEEFCNAETILKDFHIYIYIHTKYVSIHIFFAYPAADTYSFRLNEKWILVILTDEVSQE